MMKARGDRESRFLLPSFVVPLPVLPAFPVQPVFLNDPAKQCIKN
jgi:hypothetical protein